MTKNKNKYEAAEALGVSEATEVPDTETVEAPAVEAPKRYTVTIEKGRLNVRSEPRKPEGAIIGKLEASTEVLALECEAEGWLKLSEQPGYVMALYMKEVTQ